MSIYINKDTKVITQGITGKTGQFHTEKCQEYANGKNCFVAGVNPKKAGESFEGIPIHASVKDAKKATGATVSVIYVPPAGAADAIWEAVEADLDLVICITEGIPVKDMLVVRNKMKQKEAAGGQRTTVDVLNAQQALVNARVARPRDRSSAVRQSWASVVMTSSPAPSVLRASWQRLSTPPRGPLTSESCTLARGTSALSRRIANLTRATACSRSSVPSGWRDSKMTCMTISCG